MAAVARPATTSPMAARSGGAGRGSRSAPPGRRRAIRWRRRRPVPAPSSEPGRRIAGRLRRRRPRRLEARPRRPHAGAARAARPRRRRAARDGRPPHRPRPCRSCARHRGAGRRSAVAARAAARPSSSGQGRTRRGAPRPLDAGQRGRPASGSPARPRWRQRGPCGGRGRPQRRPGRREQRTEVVGRGGHAGHENPDVVGGVEIAQGDGGPRSPGEIEQLHLTSPCCLLRGDRRPRRARSARAASAGLQRAVEHSRLARSRAHAGTPSSPPTTAGDAEISQLRGLGQTRPPARYLGGSRRRRHARGLDRARWREVSKAVVEVAPMRRRPRGRGGTGPRRPPRRARPPRRRRAAAPRRRRAPGAGRPRGEAVGQGLLGRFLGQGAASGGQRPVADCELSSARDRTENRPPRPVPGRRRPPRRRARPAAPRTGRRIPRPPEGTARSGRRSATPASAAPRARRCTSQPASVSRRTSAQGAVIADAAAGREARRGRAASAAVGGHGGGEQPARAPVRLARRSRGRPGRSPAHRRAQPSCPREGHGERAGGGERSRRRPRRVRRRARRVRRRAPPGASSSTVKDSPLSGCDMRTSVVVPAQGGRRSGR